MGKSSSTSEHLETLESEEGVVQAREFENAESAKTIQQSLLQSRQGGYFPMSTEEKAHSRALNRKLDWFLLPLCGLMYLFNGLDRSNIGNAQTDGFTTDLGIPATAINNATSLFFATYVPLMPISAAMSKKVGYTYWLGIILTGWGAMTLGHAFIKTEAQLIVLRLFIGVFEAGFYATVVSYLSLFYPRFDLAFRIAMFSSFYAMAGAFGGLIAYGSFHIDGPLQGWQYSVSVVGYLAYGLTLRLVNRWKAGKIAAMTAEQIEEENLGDERYADTKYTFVYGL
ncbi:major facilitator superfamily domain-containing protein [Aspergillus bertholletiae]|uniref:Major facilitator superfamily domain-containing protein n=1 Tax=Aspergillus bertholletiae TaxID=1226010 RepID=A0A5N7BQH3_9EURO|nr:major facilitator superfamily domain-containing protein [Aspergillus bertholletiae]